MYLAAGLANDCVHKDRTVTKKHDIRRYTACIFETSPQWLFVFLCPYNNALDRGGVGANPRFVLL